MVAPNPNGNLFMTTIFRALILCLSVFVTPMLAESPNSVAEHSDSLNPADQPAPQSPDFAEAVVPGKYFGPVLKSFGNTAASAQQQRGALSGKIVFMNSGHGWT